MDVWAVIAAIEVAAGVPEGPARGGCRSLDAGCVGFEEVELVRWVVVDRTAQQGQQRE